MSEAKKNSPSLVESIVAAVEGWKEIWLRVLLLLLMPVVAAGLGVLGLRTGGLALELVASFILLGFLILGVLLIRTLERRRSEKRFLREAWAELKANRKPTTPFRGLCSFEERDDLPGRERRYLGREIATKISNEAFTFGVVCGDSGCGKTSLLRSQVTQSLRELNHDVVYVHGRTQLSIKASTSLSLEERLTRELRTLSRKLGSNSEVVVLDQFEEWFIEYQDLALRTQIGAFLRKLTQRPARVVCAIRSDFRIAFDEIADQLPKSLLVGRNLFHVTNFTINQAIDIVKECAAIEGIPIDSSFAKTVADDLAEAGNVRPPELQIVCTYLASRGGLVPQNLHREGGTETILAEYIKQAVSSCKNPNVGARLLRALCDFPAHLKQKPKSLDELANQVGSGVNERRLIEETAGHFASARLLLEHELGHQPVFSLMHDYLVDAVQIATSDVSTRAEEANQFLSYYVREKAKIPLRRLRFIRAFADRRLLAETKSKRLLRRSVIDPIIRFSAMLVVVLLLIAGGYLALTVRYIEWSSSVVNRHWSEGHAGSVTPVQIGKHLVATGTKEGEPDVCIWNAQTGQLVKKFSKPDQGGFGKSALGRFILFNKGVAPLTLVDLSSMKEWELSKGSNFRFPDQSEEWLTASEEDESHPGTGAVYVYSLKNPNVVTKIDDFPDTYKWPSLRVEGNRLVVLTHEGQPSQDTAHLYDIPSGRRIATLRDNQGGNIITFDLSTVVSQILTISRRPSGELVCETWDLSNGESLRVDPYSADDTKKDFDEQSLTPRVKFSKDGSNILITGYNRRLGFGAFVDPAYDTPIWTMRAHNAADCQCEFPGEDWAIATRKGPFILYWPTSDGTAFWDATINAPITARGMTVGEREPILNEAGDRALIWRDQVVELWNLTTGEMIRTLPHPHPLRGVSFAINDSAVILWQEPDYSLFDPADGSLVVEGFRDLANLISYDRDCRRIIIWNGPGQVVQYVEGRKYFWKFVANRRCQ